MRHIIRIMLVSVMLLLSNLSMTYASISATIPDNEIALGGLTVGMSPGSVQDIYGAPDKIENKNGKMFYLYGESLGVIFWYNPYKTNRDMEIESIVSVANNGFSTPAGVSVGMSYGEMVSIYGKHPAQAGPSHGSTVGYYYYGTDGKRLYIEVVNKKITQLRAYQDA